MKAFARLLFPTSSHHKFSSTNRLSVPTSLPRNDLAKDAAMRVIDSKIVKQRRIGQGFADAKKALWPARTIQRCVCTLEDP